MSGLGECPLCGEDLILLDELVDDPIALCLGCPAEFDAISGERLPEPRPTEDVDSRGYL